MTEKLYYLDAYATKFTAKVLECTEDKKNFKVVLDRTLFYPEGGGQPADMGTLGGVKVLDVHEKDDIVAHTTDKPLEVGAEVEGIIDWERRFDLMQNHSGEHILSGVICAKYGCDNVGFHMGKEMITIDLNTKIPEEDLPWLEEKANEAIWNNVPVGIRYPSKEELDALDYRSKKELEGQVRIVNVGEYDCCACCGTHVKLAGEVGQIKIISAQNYKGGTRLELLCGKRALQDFRKKNDVSAEAGKLLSVPADKVGGAVKNLLAERDELIQTLNQVKWKYFNLKAEQVAEGTENILFFGEGLNSKDMTHFADLLLKKAAKRTAVFSPSGDGFAFVLLSVEKDGRDFTDAMKEPFACKGGGKPDAVQGRVTGAKKDIQAFFEERGFLVEE
ncbi:MAG: alanyl-tRNA editing protein [Anaerotignum sp.]|nr:alanyl-tRNA editing protein [Anaerotignum sp.]